MHSLVRAHVTELRLGLVLAAIIVVLSLASPSFLTLGNIASLLNNNAVNMIWAVGLLVVLIAGGIDISFAVAASVVQYLATYVFAWAGGGDWVLGVIVAGGLGIGLGLINAGLIHGFRIVSIVVTIATFNAFFGLLMFLTSGRQIYDLPDWWTDRMAFLPMNAADGSVASLNAAVVAMAAAMAATWFLLHRTTTGRQLFAFGDNAEGARRAGINVALMQAIAFGWCGMMAGIGGLMQVNIAQEVVPSALIGRELEVLAAAVLGGARLGGGRGSIIGCALGVLLVAVTQNGLNLLGVSPFAFKMVIGAIILIAISTTSIGRREAGRRRHTQGSEAGPRPAGAAPASEAAP